MDTAEPEKVVTKNRLAVSLHNLKPLCSFVFKMRYTPVRYYDRSYS